MSEAERPTAGAKPSDLVDPRSRVPLHVQVRRLIREKAREGSLVDSDGRLKTETELGAIFGVSRITIRNALQPLVEEGMFSRTRGRGTFLRSAELENWGGTLIGFVEAGHAAGFEPGARVLASGMTNRFDEAAAQALRERAAFRIKRLRFADGMAVAIEDAFYPPDIGLELEARDLSTAAIYRIFETELGLEIGHARQTIGAVLADAGQAAHLGIRRGDALTAVERLTVGTDDRPLEWLRAVYVPEHFRFSIRLTRRSAPDADQA